MAVRKLKNTWWVDFQFDTVRYRKRSPENSYSGALAYQTKLKKHLARGEPIDRAPEKQEFTFEKFAWKWVDDYVKPNNKYSEQLAKRYILSASLVPYFGRMPIGKIRAHDIERYKAQQVQKGFKNKTIMNRLTVLNKCLATAYEWL